MDVRWQQVYGRGRRKNNIQLFSDLLESSPVRPSISTKANNSSTPSKPEVREQTLPQKEENEIDVVIGKIELLDITKTRQNDSTVDNTQVLRSRDINVQAVLTTRENKRDRKKFKGKKAVLTPVVQEDDVPCIVEADKSPNVVAPKEDMRLSTALKKLELAPEDQLVEELGKVTIDPPKATASTASTSPLSVRARRHQAAALVKEGVPETLPIEFLEYTRPLLSLCSDSQASLAPISFQTWSDSVAQFFEIIKIAEASYGEVYRLSLKTPQAGLGRSDESVLKIIALEPPPTLKPLSGMTAAQKDKVANMSELADVVSEVRLLQRMSPVPGFTNFRDVRVLRGRLPTQFVAAWRYFHKNVKTSCFADPGRKTTHDENQLWAVVEMQDAGKDLETVPIESEDMCWDAFWGVAIALAKGEEWAEFEHRDLHLGNICVRWKTPSTDAPQLERHHAGRKLGFTNIETTIIDYTLSRALMSSLTTPPEQVKNVLAIEYPSQTQETAFFDLSKDAAIFQGDASAEYQYEIYRSMRSAVLLDDPSASTPEPSKQKSSKNRKKVRACADPTNEKQLWERYSPLTNLVWLHFVLHEMAKQLPVNTRTLFTAEAVPSDGAPDNKTAVVGLRSKLRTLQDMLELKALSKDVRTVASAKELVEWAVGQGWLDEKDVVSIGTAGDGDEEEVCEVAKGKSTSRRRGGGNKLRKVDTHKMCNA